MSDGILLIDKPEGMNSRQVDNALARLFKTKRVGHLGTLDPFASGLLLIAIGKATKSLPYIDDSFKMYEARLLLGEKTATGDPEGEIIERKPVPQLKKEEIEEVLRSFLGVSEQIPPLYSAIKVGGEALYKKARRGEDAERKPRRIFIRSISLLSFDEGSIAFSCEVSKGTYIRTLGEDITLRLGTLGHLVSLRRITLGKTSLSQALKLSAVTEATPLLDPSAFIALPHAEVDDVSPLMNGRPISLPLEEEMVLLTHEGKALAIYKRQKGRLYAAMRGLF